MDQTIAAAGARELSSGRTCRGSRAVCTLVVSTPEGITNTKVQPALGHLGLERATLGLNTVDGSAEQRATERQFSRDRRPAAARTGARDAGAQAYSATQRAAKRCG